MEIEIPAPPANLAEQFFRNVERHPHKTALIESVEWDGAAIRGERMWTFAEFAKLVRHNQRQLDAEGFKAGDRVLILLPVSVSMYALVSALFANGIVPIFFDQDMETKQFRRAIARAGLKAVFSTLRLYRWRWVLPSLWPLRLYALSESGFALKDWNKVVPSANEIELVSCAPESTALISFTSGSSGRPKAADRWLSVLHWQREIGHQLWPRNDEEIDLTLFPLVVFANLVFGTTTVLPAMDVGAPDIGLGARLSDQILRHRISRARLTPSGLFSISRPEFASRLSGVKRLVTGGAPVPRWLVERACQVMPDADGHVVYGSTEAEPISHVPFHEIQTAGDHGYLVGRPISQIEVRMKGDELLLTGPHVIAKYLFHPEDNKTTKLSDSQGKIWHRTRDTGHFDSSGRLWLTGRISDRVTLGERTLDPYPIEHPIENELKARVAFVQTRTNKAALCVERASLSREESDYLSKTLSSLGAELRLVRAIPVDRRHFWKINRRKLVAN